MGLPQITPHDTVAKLILAAVAALALMAYTIFFIARPRCNDIGINWAWSFLALVPYLNLLFGLYLLFWPPKANNL